MFNYFNMASVTDVGALNALLISNFAATPNTYQLGYTSLSGTTGKFRNKKKKSNFRIPKDTLL